LNDVESGVYFLEMTSGGMRISKKIVVVIIPRQECFAIVKTHHYLLTG